MTEFKREERYIVVKRSDFVTQQDEKALRGWLEKFCVPTRECVVVEADWPIYEQVWDMVQRVAEGRPQKVDDSRCEKIDRDTILDESLGLPRWMVNEGTAHKVAAHCAKRINSLRQQLEEATERRDHWFRERERELDENERLRRRVAELEAERDQAVNECRKSKARLINEKVLLREESEALAAHMERQSTVIFKTFAAIEDGDLDAVPYDEARAIHNEQPSTSLARRDLIKQAEALDEIGPGLVDIIDRSQAKRLARAYRRQAEETTP